MAAKSKSASRKTASPVKKLSAKKSKAVATVKKTVRKTASKAGLKKVAKHSRELQMQVVEFVRTNPGREILHAAVEKFDIGYDHLKDWLKKEGVQVAETVEHLIASKKSAALKKGEEKLGDLAKAIEAKKKELDQLTQRLKAAQKK